MNKQPEILVEWNNEKYENIIYELPDTLILEKKVGDRFLIMTFKEYRDKTKNIHFIKNELI